MMGKEDLQVLKKKPRVQNITCLISNHWYTQTSQKGILYVIGQLGLQNTLSSSSIKKSHNLRLCLQAKNEVAHDRFKAPMDSP